MPPPAEPKTFASDFRRFFGRGLAVLLPSILTLWLLWTAFVFVFNNVAVPINKGIRWVVIQTAPTVLPPEPSKQPHWYHVSDAERDAFLAAPQNAAFRRASPARIEHEVRLLQFRDFWNSHWYLEATGLVVAVTLIYLAGLMLGGLIGRRIYGKVETYISRVPGFKQIYPHVKQLVDLIIGDKPMAFKRVVLVEYPRKGIWTVGLVTSNSLRSAAEFAGRPCLTIFIPSTPTPFTGFTINVAEDDVMDLPISIDEALRFVLTGGVLVPERETVGPVDPRTAALQARVEGADTGRQA
jgi:uncharacterized membrane protein